MVNSDSTTISLRKQQKRADWKRAYYEAKAKGLPAWRCERRTPEGYVRHNEQIKRYMRTQREANNRAVRKYRAKQKELYGGRIDKTTEARARWILAKMLPSQKDLRQTDQ